MRRFRNIFAAVWGVAHLLATAKRNASLFPGAFSEMIKMGPGAQFPISRRIRH